jgi:hypothetical protein
MVISKLKKKYAQHLTHKKSSIHQKKFMQILRNYFTYNQQ